MVGGPGPMISNFVPGRKRGGGLMAPAIQRSPGHVSSHLSCKGSWEVKYAPHLGLNRLLRSIFICSVGGCGKGLVG